MKKVSRGQSGVRRVERGLVVNDDNDDGTQRDLDRGGGGGRHMRTLCSAVSVQMVSPL